ncbi:hypothetical protein PR048_028460 [Dryococelus australis]|uniref:Uncharacterized protein n=1 Tax=Dryococelus australis TaxID=614101 RepID=A0ABQ9GAM0_9NEOP|nr:hypothetical protein PR048_028460 [Dryococelus australis]
MTLDAWIITLGILTGHDSEEKLNCIEQNGLEPQRASVNRLEARVRTVACFVADQMSGRDPDEACDTHQLELHLYQLKVTTCPCFSSSLFTTLAHVTRGTLAGKLYNLRWIAVTNHIVSCMIHLNPSKGLNLFTSYLPFFKVIFFFYTSQNIEIFR